MDIRYSTNPNDVKRYTTQELRDEFLITGLYKADEASDFVNGHILYVDGGILAYIGKQP